MPIPEAITTPRLIGQRIDDAHFGDLCRFHADERVMATLGGVVGAEETRRRLDAYKQHWRERGLGWWAFRTRHDSRFVGRGGLKPVVIDDVLEVEVGYGLMFEFWGQGLATEIARHSIEVAREHLSLAALVSLTLPHNQASRNVMEKCGFRYERDFTYRDFPHVLYRLPLGGPL